MLVAISTLKFDCSREMKAIPHSTWGSEMNISLGLFTVFLIVPFKDLRAAI